MQPILYFARFMSRKPSCNKPFAIHIGRRQTVYELRYPFSWYWCSWVVAIYISSPIHPLCHIEGWLLQWNSSCLHIVSHITFLSSIQSSPSLVSSSYSPLLALGPWFPSSTKRSYYAINSLCYCISSMPGTLNLHFRCLHLNHQLSYWSSIILNIRICCQYYRV